MDFPSKKQKIFGEQEFQYLGYFDYQEKEYYKRAFIISFE